MGQMTIRFKNGSNETPSTFSVTQENNVEISPQEAKFDAPVQTVTIEPSAPVYVDRIVEVPVDRIVEIEKEVIKYVDVPFEKIVEVVKEVQVEVIKEVEKIVEVAKDVPCYINRIVVQYKTPNYVLMLLAAETVLLLSLLIIKIT